MNSVQLYGEPWVVLGQKEGKAKNVRRDDSKQDILRNAKMKKSQGKNKNRVAG